MSDVRPRIRDISTRLGENALMVVAVEEGVLDIALASVLAPPRSAHPIRLETGLLQDDIQPPLARVLGRDVGLDGEHEGVRLLDERVVCLLLLHFSCLAAWERPRWSQRAFRVGEGGVVE